MSVKWYYVENNDRVGPVEQSAIIDLIKTEKLNDNSYVWNKEFGSDWKRVQDVAELKVEQEAPNGSLGIGTKIAQSILMLHHSVLETTKAENSFQQSFYLPSI